MTDTNDMHRDFQAWHGGIYAGKQKEIAFAAWQTATECAAASQWQPIETAPKEDGYLILAVAGRSFLGVWVDIPYQEYRNEDGVYLDQQDASAVWMDIADGEEVEPTHWQPLPPPPAIRKGDAS